MVNKHPIILTSAAHTMTSKLGTDQFTGTITVLKHDLNVLGELLLHFVDM